jgi:hypothetical protein
MAAAIAMAIAVAATAATPASAQVVDEDISFDGMLKMADRNKDGMVSRTEFMEAMGTAYDRYMTKMKASRSTDRMKGDALLPAGFRELFKMLYPGP